MKTVAYFVLLELIKMNMSREYCVIGKEISVFQNITTFQRRKVGKI